MNYIKKSVVVDSYEYIISICQNLNNRFTCKYIMEYCTSKIDDLNTPEVTDCSEADQINSLKADINKTYDYIDDLKAEMGAEKRHRVFLSKILKEMYGEDWGSLNIVNARELKVVPRSKTVDVDTIKGLEARIYRDRNQKKFLENILKALVGDDWGRLTLYKAASLKVISKEENINRISSKSFLKLERMKTDDLKSILKELIGDDWKKLTLDDAKNLVVIPKKDVLMDIVMRDGRAYKIVEETDTAVAVITKFDWGDNSSRKLKLWWDKQHCDIFRNCRQEILSDKQIVENM